MLETMGRVAVAVAVAAAASRVVARVGRVAVARQAVPARRQQTPLCPEILEQVLPQLTVAVVAVAVASLIKRQQAALR